MRLSLHGLALGFAAASSLGAVAATDMDDAHLAHVVHSLSDKADMVEGFIKRKVNRTETALDDFMDKIAAAKGKGGGPEPAPLSCLERAVAAATDELVAAREAGTDTIDFSLPGVYEGSLVSGGEIGLSGVATLFPECDDTFGVAVFDSRTGSYYGFVGALQLSFVLSADGTSVDIQWANTDTGDLGEFTIELGGGGGGGRRLLAKALTPAQLAAAAKAKPVKKGMLFPYKTAKEAAAALKKDHAALSGKNGHTTWCKPKGFIQSCSVLNSIFNQLRPASPQIRGVSLAHAAAARAVTATAITACRASDVARIQRTWTRCPLCATGPCNIPLSGTSPVGNWGGPCTGSNVLPYANGVFQFTAVPQGGSSTRSNIVGGFSGPVSGALAGQVDAAGQVRVQGTAGGGVCRWRGHFFTALNGNIACVGCSASGTWGCDPIDGATCSGAWAYTST